DGRGKRRMTLLMHSILNGKTYTSRYAEDCATDRRSLAALGMTWGVTSGKDLSLIMSPEQRLPYL
ncbi:MAG: hypothetical protein NTW08_05215, partial [Gammaproteobacteria bacterium]|nr:hypothetical protein [Gammaproteobacteria bacterium]